MGKRHDPDPKVLRGFGLHEFPVSCPNLLAIS